MPIMTALEKLNDLVDESDPDVDMPNIVHAFQTAEEIRAKHPDQEWFHLTGLIHDLGTLSPEFLKLEQLWCWGFSTMYYYLCMRAIYNTMYYTALPPRKPS